METSPVQKSHHPKIRTTRGRWLAGVAAGAAALMLLGVATGLTPAYAADAPVGLGTAGTYSVLGGQAVTNTGPTTLGGDLGVSPGTAITGFPPGIVGGTTHSGDAQAAQAQSDLTIAYDDAAGRAPTATVAGDLVGQTLLPGVYKSTGTLDVSGALTLDGQGNPNSVFIFQVASALTTASASSIVLTNSAQACNIYWQVGSSATLGTASTFKGTILALTSISVTTGTTVEGRALARNGQASLDTNVFTMPGCLTATASPTPTASVTPTASPSATVSPAPGTSSAPAVAGPSSVPSGTSTPTGTALAGTGGSGGTGDMNQGVNIDTAAGAGQGPGNLIGALAVLTGLAAAAVLIREMVSGARRRRN